MGQRALLGLLNIPHEQGRSDDDAPRILSIGGFRRILSSRYIGDRFEGALLNLRSNLLAGLAIAGPKPLFSQRFDLVVLWPAEPGLVAVGRERWIEPRVQHLGTLEVGAEDIPAAFGDRLF